MDLSFGTRLRLQRERRQVALSTIAADTKIKLSLLEGLERDDVSYWPEGIFRRSYVRAYARAIGLNPDEVVREFLDRFPDRVEMPPAGSAAWPDRPADGPTAPPTRLRRLVTSAISAVPTLRHRADVRDASPAKEAPPVREALPVRPLASARDTAPEPPPATESAPARDVAPSKVPAREPVRPGEAVLLTGVVPAVPSVAPTDQGQTPEPVSEAGPGRIEASPATGSDKTSAAEDAEPAAIGLSTAAEVCTRLARARTLRDAARALADAARIVDAVGLVVWTWDARVAALKPSVSHGYPNAGRAPLCEVPVDADNAVAAAFRSGEACVVERGEQITGAMVVPLLASRGCVGVLALEFREDREASQPVRAFATIVAAQLVALCEPAVAAKSRVAARVEESSLTVPPALIGPPKRRAASRARA